MPIDDSIATFLHYGYLPRQERPLLEHILACVSTPGHRTDARDAATLIRTGGRVLQACLEPVQRGLHVVPLSGGLDSRAILAALLAAGVREDVVAVTIGTPGTLDFELAIEVAERAKVRHELIDLRHVAVDEASLESALLNSEAASWAFDVFYHRLIAQRFGADATYWSGFMGGELAGAHVPAAPVSSWETAVDDFVRGAQFCRSLSPLRAGCFAASHLPAEPWCDPTTLAYGDQLDFGVRQDAYVRRTVVVSGHDYRTPFLHESWVRFILSVPLALRRKEALFKRILVDAFPDLFSIPTKNTAGLRVTSPDWAVAARIRSMKVAAAIRTGASLKDVARRRLPVPFALMNYLDFAAALRTNPHMRELVPNLLAALEERKVGVSGLRLWDAHERAGGDPQLACALTLLASLELNLRVDPARPVPLFSPHGT